jgi:hypothetical protein
MAEPNIELDVDNGVEHALDEYGPDVPSTERGFTRLLGADVMELLLCCLQVREVELSDCPSNSLRNAC